MAVVSAHPHELEAFGAASARHGHAFVFLKERFDPAGVAWVPPCPPNSVSKLPLGLILTRTRKIHRAGSTGCCGPAA
jgi:hypothetical protein